MTSRVFCCSDRRRLGKGFASLAKITALVVLLSGEHSIHAQSFDSGSNGSDGALNLTTPGTYDFYPGNTAIFPSPVDPEGDNIYHFTSINIASGVTVRLSGKFLNGPVFWLASGPVQINGSIDLNGEGGQEVSPAGVPFPPVPGAGGYSGGVKGQKGNGPLGGDAAMPLNQDCFLNAQGGGGPSNNFLVPLLGGSGGGAYGNSGGGAGGGALLIASSASITVTGTVTADGGTTGTGFANGEGAGGGGGGIRLAAPTINGTGTLGARGGGRGGSGAGGSCNQPGGGKPGVIRLEAFQQSFTGSASPTPVQASPFALFLPTTPPPSVRVTHVDGQLVPSNPTGSFTMPDVTINKSIAVTVNIVASNIPPGTVVKLYISSENAPDQTVDSLPLAGTLASSTATASVVLPPGFSRGFVRATWTTQ